MKITQAKVRIVNVFKMVQVVKLGTGSVWIKDSGYGWLKAENLSTENRNRIYKALQ